MTGGARKTAAAIVLAVLVAAFTPFGARAQTAEPQDARRARALAFIRELSQAFARRDRAAVADRVSYPATASVGGLGIPLVSRDDLLMRFTSIFTPEVRCFVEASANGGAIDVNAGVVTFANGHIRAKDAGATFLITHVSVPASLGLAGPSTSQRVGLRRGQAQFSGRLYVDGVDTYTLSAQKGDVLQVRIEGFTGRNASVRVVAVKGGRSLTPAGATPRLWTGTIQEPGEYRVEVVRHTSCGESFTYLLTLAMK